jgi:hypothetical protein
MNMEKEIKNSLSKILEYHIVLGVESIFANVFSAPNERLISFHHIVNRIMMVAQVPITFGVYFKNEKGLELVHLTNKHKRHRGIISSRAQYVLTKNLFPLWTNGSTESFYLLVLKADSSYEFQPLEPITELAEIHSAWDAASYKIWRMLTYKEHSLYSDFYKLIGRVLQKFKESEHKETEVQAQYLSLDETLKKSFDKELLENTTQYALSGVGVIDKVFNKLKKNFSNVTRGVDAEDQGQSLTNFLLFARDYSVHNLNNTRYGGEYDYGIRLLLCANQREQIKDHFIWMRKERKKCRDIFKKQISTIQDSNCKELATQVDDILWRMLDLKQDEDVIQILAGYFSGFARSMADPVFDGVSFYRQPFSKDAGMGRCFHDGVIPSSLGALDKDDPRRNDLLRVVAFQYLFEAMTTESRIEGTGLQVMLNPIELGGRVWGVVGYATRSSSLDAGFKTIDDVEDFGRYWLMNYHVYRDVNERMKKNLRSNMNRFYENFVAARYTDWINEIDRAGTLSVSEAENLLNKQFASLSCIFPYNVIEATIVEDVHSKKTQTLPTPASDGVLRVRDAVPGTARCVPIGVGWKVEIDASNKSLFPNAPNVTDTGFFVDVVDMAVVITDRTIRSVVIKAVNNSQTKASSSRNVLKLVKR